MKVQIGDYRNFVGPYQIAEKILFWRNKYKDGSVYEFGQRLAKIGWLVKLCDWIDSKKKRTVKVKVHDYDVWNADSTLAYIIHPVLVKLKETKNGSPFVDDADVPENLRSTAVPPAEDGCTDDNFHKRWDYVLDEMIFAFENVNRDWQDQFHTDGFDKEGYKKFEERMQTGFRLFGKYYFALWD